MKRTKIYGFGIVGCGIASRQHAKAIEAIDGAQLVGVCDRVHGNAQSFANEYGCVAFDSYESLLACKDIDIVCICTPSGYHAEGAVMAANAGKHFIVEKPMAITEKQLDSVTEACERNNVKGAVISQHRVTDTVLYVKKAIDDGVFGDIISGDVTMKYYRSPEYYKSASWRGTWELDGGGVLMNQGIHGIDVLQYLMGDVESVHAVCKTLARDIETEDTALVLVQYKNGAVGSIFGSTAVNPGYPRVISINGTKGSVEITEDTITKWDTEDGCEIPTGNETSVNATFRNPQALADNSHKRQIEDMIEALEQDRRPIVDIYEGRKPVDIILASYRSSESKKTVLL